MDFTGTPELDKVSRFNVSTGVSPLESTDLQDVCIGIREQTDSSMLRRTAFMMAAQLGFDETASGRLGIVVTELSRNVLKHAGEGQVIVRSLREAGPATIEVLALDKGPGIANVARSFEDGVSTTGTPGTGLGAV